MLKKTLSIVKYVVPIIVAAVLLFFAFRNVDFAEFIEKVEKVDYSWVIFSIVLSLVAYYARAYRWNILLKPSGYKNLSIWRTGNAVMIGYLANLALPRLGEITRCGMLKRSDDVPVSTSLGTVISERIIDFLTLLVLIGVALIVEYEIFLQFLNELFSKFVDAESLGWKLAIGLAVLAVVLLGGWLLMRLAGPKVKAFIRELYEGVLSLRKIENLSGFIVSTLVLWVVYYFMSYVIVFSLPETAHLDGMVGIMLLVTGGIALALPVQGGFGTYHTLVSVMLALYAVETTTGVFLATVLHTSQVVAIAIFGGIALLATVLKTKSKKSEANDSHEATA